MTDSNRIYQGKEEHHLVIHSMLGTIHSIKSSMHTRMKGVYSQGKANSQNNFKIISPQNQKKGGRKLHKGIGIGVEWRKEFLCMTKNTRPKASVH